MMCVLACGVVVIFHHHDNIRRQTQMVLLIRMCCSLLFCDVVDVFLLHKDESFTVWLGRLIFRKNEQNSEKMTQSSHVLHVRVPYQYSSKHSIK